VKIDYGQWARVTAMARRYSRDELDLDDAEGRAFWENYVFLASAVRPLYASGGVIYLECSRYDSEHEACSAYEDRPPLCRRFPWYGREPGDGNVPAESRCSYLLDVPPATRPEGARPLIPLTVL